VIQVHHAAGSKRQIIGERNVLSQRGRFGILGLLLCLALVYGVVVLTGPWAVHIGNGWTPLLYWTGTGRLITKSGTYPLFVSLLPSTHSSQLHLDGLRPTGGVQGRGWLCTSSRTIIPLELSGTIYGASRTTDGALMQFRLLEYNGPGHQLLAPANRGYLDLYGYWHGPQLVMNDRGAWSSPFRSGLRIEHASVTLKGGSKSEFEAACASTTDYALRR